MTQEEALTILKTGANVFLTGEPGSGKTYTINKYIAYLKEKGISVAITASTGIAATHLGGMTIHSWSGIGITKKITDYDADRIASTERIVKRMKKVRVLVIDEISMLDADTLTSIDKVCKAVFGRSDAFGGLQVIFVGDFFQLPPVYRAGEAPAEFAFLSSAWAGAQPISCYITEQHRQADAEFLELLGALRADVITPAHRALLDERNNILDEESLRDVTKLYSHNADVDAMNAHELARLEGTQETFHMKSTGPKNIVQQLQKGCLSPKELLLKEGAIVMFTKNSQAQGFANGTLGEVIGFDSYKKYPIVQTKAGDEITVEPMDWMVEDNGSAVARISQIPLRLAWAITVHKSQGMSLDSAYMDLRRAFVEGQGYVALSRVRSLQGLYLAGYNTQALTIHPTVFSYDTLFREHSDSVQKEFKNLSKKDITTMHKNYLKHLGK
ncbi:MAG: AAA family ATPase [Candidatus Andersenbacteria bacterium]